MTKPFASTTDLAEKRETVEVLADGVYALTAEGDPNVAAIEGEDFLVCFDARATPAMAGRWLARLREHTDKPVRHLVLSHYHAVRVLGASAFDAQEIITHAETKRLIDERGQEDWEVELGRMPRLFQGQETIPGLTTPTLTFADRLTIELGGDRGVLELAWLGRGHTSGDIIGWLPEQRILLGGDLVENGAAVYTGDAYHREWMTTTLDRVAAFDADVLVGGRGSVALGRADVARAIALTRDFLTGLVESVGAVQRRGGTLEEAFAAAHQVLEPTYGGMAVFKHALVFDVQRVWDELQGELPRMWTVDRDQAVWQQLA